MEYKHGTCNLGLVDSLIINFCALACKSKEEKRLHRSHNLDNIMD